MLVYYNEYGSPWNEQYYKVTYKQYEDVYKDTLILNSGNYSNEELIKYAQDKFPNATIIKIEPYEIFR